MIGEGIDFGMYALFQAANKEKMHKPHIIAMSEAIYEAMLQSKAEKKFKEKIGTTFAALGLNKRIKG